MRTDRVLFIAATLVTLSLLAQLLTACAPEHTTDVVIRKQCPDRVHVVEVKRHGRHEIRDFLNGQLVNSPDSKGCIYIIGDK